MSVSIVMPNFNNARFIRQALESVIQQKVVTEVVIYDNCSTDASIAIAESLGSDKIRVIKGSANIGATLGRHEAVLAAKNDLICCLDGDDFVAPGAVTAVHTELIAQELDIALFDLINVDANGQHPEDFIIPPRDVMHGRQACAKTLGGWDMHIWGVFRKTLYLDAWAKFQPHGYSDDELLTRSILLSANRIAGGGGRFFYRVIRKPQHLHHIIGVNRTAVRTLALGSEHALDPVAVQKQHEMVVRFLFGILRRALVGKIPHSDAAALIDEYCAIGLSPPRSFAGRAMARAIRIGRPLLGEITPSLVGVGLLPRPWW